ncbi:MAG: hypothetical protein GY940_05605, partial [bacterium]|nr:hypothetical protein [bacterium]
AGNLSELMLTLGQVREAVAYGDRAVAHADKSGEWFEKMRHRYKHADALHQAGQWQEAEQLFREAEAMQKERQKEFHYLYGLNGYQFCDLLLSQGEKGKVEEVMERAQQTLGWAKQFKILLDIALNNLTLGRAWMMAAQQRITKTKTEPNLAWKNAFQFLHLAVEGLRKAGTQDYLPRGLLARSAAFRLKKQFHHAWTDLNEAHEIAQMGEMKLHLVDYHLEAAKLCKDEGDQEKAGEHLREAEGMITETGYLRRGKEVEEIINYKL